VLARAALIAAVLTAPAVAIAQTAGAPLVLEMKIPLGEVSGRIDHLAIDLSRQRLFVAELGNNSLGVVDLRAAKLLRTVSGMAEPQGVAYVPFVDSIYVANGGDGSVRVLRGDDLTPTGRIELGNDADNVRDDALRNRVLVGYGNGALAVIDAASQTKMTDLRLHGHPEGFQLDDATSQIFVNVPDARQIEIVDLASKASQSLATRDAGSNFPMAIDRDGRRVLVVFRNPPTLMAFSMQERRLIAKLGTCSDADDVFVDPKRRRIYVSCGEGALDVLEQSGSEYRRLARISTIPGARTSLFVPELDRLFVAVRARSNEPAAIWVFRPVP